MDAKKQTMAHILTHSPVLSQIVFKTKKLAELNAIVHQKLAPDLAKYCRVANYREGVLVLLADSPATGHLLRFAKQALLSDLKALPNGTQWAELNTIKVLVNPPLKNQDQTEKMLPFKSSELSTRMMQHLKSIAATITFKPLQKALLRLCRTDD